MKIEQISLTHYRNINNILINFDTNVTVLVGENGQGKTNILEAIHYCSTSRSFRVKDDQLCIQNNQTLSRIIGVFEVNHIRKQLKIVINKEGKYLFENNKSFTTNKEFIGLVNTVLFSPYDLFLFDGSPKTRRKFIDTELSKLFPEFVNNLYNYNKLLKERNNALKHSSIDKMYIETLDEQLIMVSIIIIKYRSNFIHYLDKHIPELFQDLVQERDWEVNINLESSVSDSEKLETELRNLYKQAYQKDLLFKSTQVGIHKDDLSVKINGQDITHIASQGQKRMMIIALKLCLIQYIKEITKEFPILLLDDVFSEIDEAKRRRFIEFLPDSCQTIVTTTDRSHIQLWSKEKYSVLSVKNGELVKE
jgi:DNA replication and repair protein RecF